MSSVSPTVKFCRWALLVTGVVYGASHHSTLAKREAAAKKAQEAQEAKKQKAQKAQAASSTNDLEMDPNSPNFDLEKVLLSLEKQEAKN
ncbi:hypothetical protein PTSG_00250 [Salpingoeca rosetta]|uniref:ATP synthase F(0) complex subunit e, mitochondrial n=1 Tax=Salpingoeca rosetta (strain ATCC 50818 / BSB-021) TaxID=946362 RepID=F2TVY4_SALR5|nr:uncharacterized protein PTSG_00250 [Salpingoeca rosetta]EGD72230.1 hypothetical protein PTSG_00250 [Salpingoeca rosetta]|eukprot:XP_004998801.1 hypothetical protein PTSG_00250 [Salpingoeca rosetta]